MGAIVLISDNRLGINVVVLGFRDSPKKVKSNTASEIDVSEIRNINSCLLLVCIQRFVGDAFRLFFGDMSRTSVVVEKNHVGNPRVTIYFIYEWFRSLTREMSTRKVYLILQLAVSENSYYVELAFLVVAQLSVGISVGLGLGLG